MDSITEPLREPLRRALRGETVAWPAITAEDAAAIRAQGLGPLVYASSHAPALRSDALAAAVAEPLRLADLQEVVRALPFAPLILKGTALAYQVYAAPELRPRTDTDLLIARD
ncbi:MAG TPA: nucleotidyltransferase family protein, partial [Thermoanaerobaculia bacterium]|nr:nucleotidyltransferase family protein [Thermoanaerobaculia bacterium]